LAFHSGREADHSPSSSAEVKEWVELYFQSPNTPSWRGAQGEHRDTFTFTCFFSMPFDYRRLKENLHLTGFQHAIRYVSSLDQHSYVQNIWFI
jgi:hypothetical protein